MYRPSSLQQWVLLYTRGIASHWAHKPHALPWFPTVNSMMKALRNLPSITRMGFKQLGSHILWVLCNSGLRDDANDVGWTYSCRLGYIDESGNLHESHIRRQWHKSVFYRSADCCLCYRWAWPSSDQFCLPSTKRSMLMEMYEGTKELHIFQLERNDSDVRTILLHSSYVRSCSWLQPFWGIRFTFLEPVLIQPVPKGLSNLLTNWMITMFIIIITRITIMIIVMLILIYNAIQ